jgi:hypothetical protein
MNISENFGSSWITRTMVALSSRMMTHSVIDVTVAKRRGWPVKQPSPKKSPLPWIAVRCSQGRALSWAGYGVRLSSIVLSRSTFKEQPAVLSDHPVPPETFARFQSLTPRRVMLVLTVPRSE